MKTQKMRHFGKTVVAGLAAFMMLSQSFTAFACQEAPHGEAGECTEHAAAGEAILYDAQFVDEDGNVYPVDGINPQVFCIKHDIVSGYYQTHVKDDKGGCTVKTYAGTTCIYCNTIWVGDLVNKTVYAKCPH